MTSIILYKRNVLTYYPVSHDAYEIIKTIYPVKRLNKEKFKSIITLLIAIFLTLGILLSLLYGYLIGSAVLIMGGAISYIIAFNAAKEIIAYRVKVKLIYYRDKILQSVNSLIKEDHVYFIRFDGRMFLLEKLSEDITRIMLGRKIVIPGLPETNKIIEEGYMIDPHEYIVLDYDPEIEVIDMDTYVYGEAKVMAITSDLVNVFIVLGISFSLSPDEAHDLLLSALSHLGRIKTLKEIVDEVNSYIISNIERRIAEIATRVQVKIDVKLYEIISSKSEVIKRIESELQYPDASISVLGFEIADPLVATLMKAEAVRISSLKLVSDLGITDHKTRLITYSLLQASFKDYSKVLEIIPETEKILVQSERVLLKTYSKIISSC